VIFAWFFEQNPLRVVLGGESGREYLERRLDYYSYYEVINTQLPMNARIWLIDMRRDAYHLERPYFSDFTFEDYTLKKYVEESSTVAQMRARTQRELNVTHLLVRYDFLLDPARSPIIDDRLDDTEKQRRMQLLKSFLFDGTKVLRGDAKFMLIELPQN
jgi:hypothetical protein